MTFKDEEQILVTNLVTGLLMKSFQSISHVFTANDLKAAGVSNQRIIMLGIDIFSYHSKRCRVFLRILTWPLEK